MVCGEYLFSCWRKLMNLSVYICALKIAQGGYAEQKIFIHPTLPASAAYKQPSGSHPFLTQKPWCMTVFCAVLSAYRLFQISSCISLKPCLMIRCLLR